MADACWLRSQPEDPTSWVMKGRKPVSLLKYTKLTVVARSPLPNRAGTPFAGLFSFDIEICVFSPKLFVWLLPFSLFSRLPPPVRSTGKHKLRRQSMPPRKKGGATRKGANADRIGAEPSSSDLPAGDVSGPPETLIDSQAGEVASGASGKVTDGDGKIDPTLADLERAVQQRMTDGDGETTGAAGVVMGGDQLAAATISGDDEMDPAWREIVNSLANAQQVSSACLTVLAAQDVRQNAEASTSAAILGGHLGDHEDGDRLQQTLQTTLDSLTSEGFSEDLLNLHCEPN